MRGFVLDTSVVLKWFSESGKGNLDQALQLRLSLLEIWVVIFFLTSLFATGICNQASLCFIFPWDVSGASNYQWKNPAIFRSVSVDYGPKVICKA